MLVTVKTNQQQISAPMTVSALLPLGLVSGTAWAALSKTEKVKV